MGVCMLSIQPVLQLGMQPTCIVPRDAVTHSLMYHGQKARAGTCTHCSRVHSDSEYTSKATVAAVPAFVAFISFIDPCFLSFLLRLLAHGRMWVILDCRLQEILRRLAR
ncbi:hypothetical protein ABBQ38_015265 [Trebouxia sp. C0009 RCD-2024]